MTKQEETISQLKKELEKKDEQIGGLTKRIQELESQKPKSKSRQQAEEGLKMLQAGPVTREQFAKLNAKYPSDVAYYIKNILKVDVKTVRIPGKGTCYMSVEHFAIYTEGLAKEKLAAEAAAQDVKEEVPPTPQASDHSQAAAAA